ncbi:MAG: hypothetical protein RBS80_08395 [Thermoguttaceae bacterium]|nr:hypothetical protein [Thermoguttaceae bacterium]
MLHVLVCIAFFFAWLAAPATAPAGEVRFDFESGDLQGWQVVDGEFSKLLGDRKFEFHNNTVPYSNEGKHYLTTLERADSDRPDDGPTGAVESPVFVVTGPKASMLVGGGSHPTTYVALCTEDGNEVLHARGRDSQTMHRVEWDVKPWIGRRVFLRLTDRHTGGWGHITFDDFRAEGRIDAEATLARLAGRARQRIARMHQPLREAIEHLAATYGERYPKGAEYLARLDQMEGALAAATGNEAERLREQFDALRREALIANPLLSSRPILFVVRQQYTYDHHNTHNFSPDTEHEYNQGHFKPGGALKTTDLATGQITTLLESAEGVIRDPRVHWDGKRILFSMRRNRDDSFHVYEMNSDGTGLRQLTELADADDIHPLYLPDNTIVFASTREPKYVMCNRHIGANLYRMEPDGANIHQITKSTLFERPTDILPDGRILYDRWEYVDRNFGDAQALWTVAPDGTNQAVYWGNNTPAPGGVIDARIIPGTQQAVCIFSSCHDLSWGALAVIDRRLGLDGRAPVVRIWPESARDLVKDPGTANNAWDDFMRVRPKYEDPYPLCEAFFLVSRLIEGGGGPRDADNRTGIFLVDVFGNELLLHTEAPGCFNPTPLAPTARPAQIPSRRDFENAEGAMYVQDVYAGVHMEGVTRGTVKYLRVVESPEKRYWVPGVWGGQGVHHPGVNWHSFETKRILGTVPVEPDGSAYFTVPSDTFIYFQLLDGNGMMIQSMRSGTVVQSGETTGCVGCHDDRRTAPLPCPGRPMPLALRKPPAPMQGWRGSTDMFCYMTEVQPVFDKHCARCHDFGEPAGEKLLLARDRNLIFNTSYNELWRKQYIRVIGGGPAEVQPAYSWGSHASPLMRVLRNEHDKHEAVELNADEFARIAAWIDLNAVFYPDYATSYPTNPGGRSPIDGSQLNRLAELTGQDFGRHFSHSGNQGPLVSFDRSELSPILKRFDNPNDPAYLEALAIIRAGQATLAARPDVGMAGFELSGIDLWREAKYQQRRGIELRYRRAIRAGERLYDLEIGPGR